MNTVKQVCLNNKYPLNDQTGFARKRHAARIVNMADQFSFTAAALLRMERFFRQLIAPQRGQKGMRRAGNGIFIDAHLGPKSAGAKIKLTRRRRHDHAAGVEFRQGGEIWR